MPSMEIDTVIVGNGPSAMILSYILHGHLPAYSADPPHPDRLLHAKLQNAPDLLNADVSTLTEHFAASRLSYSTQALPVNVLLDTLVRPSADVEESDRITNVEWHFHPDKAVPHLIFGNAPQPGGQWTDNPMPASWEIQTLSYAAMLSLPGYSYAEHYRKTTGKDLPPFTRPSRQDLTDYLRAYPSAVDIDGVFRNGETLAGISRTRNGFYIQSHNIHCKHLVLATGIFSEVLPPPPLLQPLSSLPPSPDLPLLVVGSGFSAADMIISAPPNQKIIHVFKWDPEDRPSPLRGCHQQAYPEYAGVYRLMKRAAIVSRSRSSRPGTTRRASISFLESRRWDDVYEGLPNVEVVGVDMQQTQATVTFRGTDGATFNRQVRGLVHAVGRRGTLRYLDDALLCEVLDSANSSEEEIDPVISGQTLRSKAMDDLEVARGVFIVGSLTGDSLIRFAYGGCVYTAGRLIRAHSGEAAEDTCSCSSISTPSRPATATPLAVMNGMDGHQALPLTDVYDADQKSLAALDCEDSCGKMSSSTEKLGFLGWWKCFLRSCK